MSGIINLTTDWLWRIILETESPEETQVSLAVCSFRLITVLFTTNAIFTSLLDYDRLLGTLIEKVLLVEGQDDRLVLTAIQCVRGLTGRRYSSELPEAKPRSTLFLVTIGPTVVSVARKSCASVVSKVQTDILLACLSLLLEWILDREGKDNHAN